MRDNPALGKPINDYAAKILEQTLMPEFLHGVVGRPAQDHNLVTVSLNTLVTAS
jgi:hypothetical protein